MAARSSGIELDHLAIRDKFGKRLAGESLRCHKLVRPTIGARDMRVESLVFSGAGWQPARDPEGAPFTAAVSCKRGSLADCQSAAAYQAAPQPSPLPCLHIR